MNAGAGGDRRETAQGGRQAVELLVQRGLLEPAPAVEMGHGADDLDAEGPAGPLDEGGEALGGLVVPVLDVAVAEAELHADATAGFELAHPVDPTVGLPVP